MRALIVFESMFGNTHDVADRIAEGLRATMEVRVVPVGEAPSATAGTSFDLLVVGAPTHIHGLSRVSTRQSAAKMASEKPELQLDAAAVGPGVRDWLGEVGAGHGLAAAAFDTRLDWARAWTGSAGRGIARRLRRHGFRLVGDPVSFLVNSDNRLEDGEEGRARAWGEWLATQVDDALVAR